MQHRRDFIRLSALGAAALATPGLLVPGIANAATDSEIINDSETALNRLIRDNAAAASLSRTARGVLIFPKIVKAGLGIGGSLGKGVLKEAHQPAVIYSSFSASVGFQAGAQTYGYAVFLMTEKAITYIHDTKGWEVGVGPTVVVVDDGAAKNLSTSTLKDDAYAFIFNQQGLMAGISLEGTKISKVK